MSMNYRSLLLLLLLLSAAVEVFAQHPDTSKFNTNPSRTPHNQPARPLMFDARRASIEVTPQGVFVLYGGVLARYDANLTAPSTTVALFGPMPEQPKLSTPPLPEEREALNAWQQQRRQRQMAGALLIAGADLLIVYPDHYFRVNQQSLAIEKSTDLSGGTPSNQMSIDPPKLKMAGNMLYLLRDGEMLAIDIANGEINGRSPLPEEMLPSPPPLISSQGANPAGAGALPPAQLVGKITKHDDAGHTVWTITDVQGKEFVLAGDQAEKLLTTPNVEGRQVRITGLLLSTVPGLPKYAEGLLQIRDYELLPIK